MTPTVPNPAEPTAVVPATERAIESAVDLARAETRLALLRAKAISIRAVKTITATLLAGFLLQIGIALLVLVPLEGISGGNAAVTIIVCVTLLCSLVCGGLAMRGLAQLDRGK
jgi:hypothetical protein